MPRSSSRPRDVAGWLAHRAVVGALVAGTLLGLPGEAYGAANAAKKPASR